MIFPNGTKTMQSSNSIPLHQKLKETLLTAKKALKMI
jgi:hypothetical protein